MSRLFALLAALLLAGAAHAATLVVNAPEEGALNLRAGPSTGYAVTYQMPHGSEVEVLRSPGTWVQVRHESGRIGWASSKYLATSAEPRSSAPSPTRPGLAEENLGSLPVYYVDAPAYGGLNLRAGPGTENSVLITMTQGSRVEELGRKGEWWLLRHDSGEVGWANGAYLSAQKPGTLRAPEPQPRSFDPAPEDGFVEERIPEALRDHRRREGREWREEVRPRGLREGRDEREERRTIRRQLDAEDLPGLLLRCAGNQGNELANCLARSFLDAQRLQR